MALAPSRSCGGPASPGPVWRWQERFAEEAFEGLPRDKTRPPRIAPLGPEVAKRVVALTLSDPPGETMHWTADRMARAASISASAVRRIWKAHGPSAPSLAPVQALQRSQVRRQAQGRDRALCRSGGPCHPAVGGCRVVAE